MNKNSIIILLGCLLLASCREEEASQISSHNDDKNTFNTVFTEALTHVREDYCNDVSENKLLENALAGLLHATDPYSAYLSPREYDALHTLNQGAFGGIGLEVISTPQGLKVITALMDTPAHKAHISSGEHIVKIDNIDITQKNKMIAIEMLQGKPGTAVRLGILNEFGVEREITLERAIITINPVHFHTHGTIAYLRISIFNEQTVEKIKDAIHTFKLMEKLTGVIIDLRNNPGGILEQAVNSTGLFLERSTVVITKGRTSNDIIRYNTNGPDHLRGVPILVLVNQGSASGAEIMSASLKDNKRAILMGTKTFGKGSVQTLFPLSNQGALKLTTAYFYSPKMSPIHEKGVEPDIKVKLNDTHTLFNFYQDSQIQAAVEFFKGLGR